MGFFNKMITGNYQRGGNVRPRGHSPMSLEDELGQQNPLEAIFAYLKEQLASGTTDPSQQLTPGKLPSKYMDKFADVILPDFIKDKIPAMNKGPKAGQLPRGLEGYQKNIQKPQYKSEEDYLSKEGIMGPEGPYLPGSRPQGNGGSQNILNKLIQIDDLQNKQDPNASMNALKTLLSNNPQIAKLLMQQLSQGTAQPQNQTDSITPNEMTPLLEGLNTGDSNPLQEYSDRPPPPQYRGGGFTGEQEGEKKLFNALKSLVIK